MSDLIIGFPLYLRAIILIYLIATITVSATLFAFHLVKHEKTIFVVFMVHLLILCYLCVTVGK